MPTPAHDGRLVQLDAKGFLVDSSEWTPDLAEILARRSGIPSLTERHWRVLTCCREDAARTGRIPTLHRLIGLTGVSLVELYRLFPPTPETLVVQIAGLPEPSFPSRGGMP